MRTFVLGAAASTLLGCGDVAHDREPPDTFLDDKPAALTNEAHLRITFHPGGIANRFTCQLDGGAPTTCLSPFEADVADGDHTFAVAAALNAVVDDTPATTTWTVDTVAPDTSIVAAPPPLDNAVMPEVAFSGSDNRGAVTFECALDDGAFAACTSPATVPVTDGNRTYRVRAVDAAGNRDPSPATASWT
ncbi:MAG: choice-of-anchor D domain-containing protein, partial [bacterium]